MKNALCIITVTLLLSPPLVAQQKKALPFFVAYADGKAHLLVAEMPKGGRGFNVYRSSGGEFTLLTAEPVEPVHDPLLLRELLGQDFEGFRKALKAANEVQVLRRLQSDPGTSFAFSLANQGIARACGRLFVDENVEEGESYTYRVATVDFRGRTIVTREREVEMEAAVPSEPEDVKVEAGDGKAKITWRYPEYSGDPDDITVGFNIYRGDATGEAKINPLLILRQAGELGRVDREVRNGREYRYSVTAVDFVGRESKHSEVVVVSPKDQAPPHPPTGLTAVASEGAVTLRWKSNSEPDLASYDVYRGTSVQGEFLKIGVTPVPKEHPSLVDSGLTFGGYYFYKVRAVDSCGNQSEMSAAIPARPKDTEPPRPPVSARCELAGSSLVLRWEAPDDSEAVGYYIYRGFTRENLLRVIGRPLGQDSLEYRDDGYDHKGLWPGKKYYYAVSSVDRAQNESSKNVVAVVVPDHEPPRPPGDVNAHTTPDGQIEVRWQPSLSLDIQRYKLYRSEKGGKPEVIADTTGCLFIDRHVVKGDQYEYHLTGTDSSGNESEKSPTVAAVARSNHLAPAVRTARVVPLAEGVSISWEPVRDAELLGYNVYRSDRPGGTYAKINNDLIGETEFVDQTGRADTYYKVTTVTRSGRENTRGEMVSARRSRN